MRVTKDPEIRRKELMDVAEELFLENGYEETAVSDIVKKSRRSTRYVLLLFQIQRNNTGCNH
nr:TetR family transcriptional regulator [Methanobacterium formicicum]